MNYFHYISEAGKIKPCKKCWVTRIIGEQVFFKKDQKNLKLYEVMLEYLFKGEK